MLKIVLCCSAAMSTSLLVQKIKTAADKNDFPIEICASGLNDLESVAHNADIILMAPQVQYAKKHVKRLLTPIPVIDISVRDYGLMNGTNVFNDILKTLNLHRTENKNHSKE